MWTKLTGLADRWRRLQTWFAHGMLFMVMLTKISKKITTKLSQGVYLGLIAVLLLGTFITVPLVRADQFDDQIKQLQQENAANRAEASVLQAQAETYQQMIDQLQSQINELQKQIRANEARRDELKNQITQAEMELERQKQVLGMNIKTMYLEGEITTLEMLATSKDLNEFVDRQQYRDSVQNKIKATLDKINELKTQLTAQKLETDKLLQEQQVMQSQLATDRAKQSEMLAYTEAQKRATEAEIKSNNQQMSTLRAQQAAFYASITNGGKRNYGSAGNFSFRALSAQQYCGGGYSYCWARHDQWVSDPWGLGLARECVHYAADRGARNRSLLGYFGNGRGNATNWPTSLSNAPGVVIDRNPEVGSVAIAMAQDLGNPYGHAMYVEYIGGDGWVGVSQMNWDGRGSYSTMEIKATGVWYIHFR